MNTRTKDYDITDELSEIRGLLGAIEHLADDSPDNPKMESIFAIARSAANITGRLLTDQIDRSERVAETA